MGLWSGGTAGWPLPRPACSLRVQTQVPRWQNRPTGEGARLMHWLARPNYCRAVWRQPPAVVVARHRLCVRRLAATRLRLLPTRRSYSGTGCAYGAHKGTPLQGKCSFLGESAGGIGGLALGCVSVGFASRAGRANAACVMRRGRVSYRHLAGGPSRRANGVTGPVWDAHLLAAGRAAVSVQHTIG